uniref:Large ribosomal subunit protein bL21c n=1 Tax=Schizocladia ischiensis TaxID=196139 RepID=A0A7S6UA35_9STRA|nr:ribosomal protein L21.1 [Schizocladia ischiensis]YP_010032379.1 ribosomal protein L21.2 [Schizocladia ischiensis]QOW07533.1 ribosomal protein L21.1 [Schizocladia ischiensis]QOW07586.1 ribosomal protein L21.2 [Schizocladia ischiensis]
MDYAIIEASGRQYWIEPKNFININRIPIKTGSTLEIRRILFVKKEESIFIGQPYLNQFKIKATVGKHFLGPKLVVFKMKPKKKYKRKSGHRQQLSRLVINTIES